MKTFIKFFIKNHPNLAVFIFFAIAIFTLYGSNLFYDWTFYDDDVLILDKQDYLSFSNIKNILTDTVFGQEGDKFCRPVLNLTFLFEKYLYGTDPFGYHLTNIILHLLCVFFLYLTLTLKYDRKKTFVLCLLFAVHPVLVQAVSWIPGRNDTLLTLFIILSFYFLVRLFVPLPSSSCSHPSIPLSLYPSKKKRLIFFSLHLLFFSLALFTKETAIFAPLFYILFIAFAVPPHSAVIPEGRNLESMLNKSPLSSSDHPTIRPSDHPSSSVIPEGRSRESAVAVSQPSALSSQPSTPRSGVIADSDPQSMLNKPPLSSSDLPSSAVAVPQPSALSFSAAVLLYIIISSGYLFYRSFVLSYQTQSLNFKIFFDSFITSFPAVTKYIANIFFPVKLTVFSAMASADYILCAVVFLVFMWLLLKFREYEYNIKIVLFGFAWFFAFLLPTFIIPYNPFYDHRIYLSLAGIILSISEIIKNYEGNFSKKIIILFLIIFVMFSLMTLSHSHKFMNRDVFWINALVDSPESDIANSVVAGILVEHRVYGLAEEKYLKAISIHENSKHYVNLAVLYIKTGRFDKAEECLLKAQSLDEYNPEVYYNLALVYKVKGDMEKAQYMKSLFEKIFRATNRVAEVPELRI